MVYTDSRQIVIEVVGKPNVKITEVEAPSKAEIGSQTYLVVKGKVVSTGARPNITVQLAIENLRGNPGSIVVSQKEVPPGKALVVNIGTKKAGDTFAFNFLPIFNVPGKYTLKIYAGYA